mgnify:CR=1 FL=1
MTRTVTLNAETYRLSTFGEVQIFAATETGYQVDYDAQNFTEELEKCHIWDWHQTKYAVGNQAVLVSSTQFGRSQYHLYFDLDGVPGNSDASIRRTEGWRGTTDDVSVDAHGVVKNKKIRKLKNGNISVTVE